MKKIQFVLFLIPAIFFLSSCETENVVSGDIDIPVVECMFQSGFFPDTVRVSNILSYGDDNNDVEWISGLEVNISIGVDTYAFEETSLPGHYICADESVKIIPGEAYNLEIWYNETLLSASVIVPATPSEVVISDNTLYVPTFGSGGGGMMEGLDITWSADNDTYYYVSVENIETDPELAMSFAIDDSTNMPPVSTVTAPTEDNFYNITLRDVSYLGTHRVVIFAVTEEYVKLTERSGTSSISLTDPYTNIENGYGLFSAFASDTIYFEVE